MVSVTVAGIDIGSAYSKIATITFDSADYRSGVDQSCQVVTDAEGERSIPSTVASISGSTVTRKGRSVREIETTEVTCGTPAAQQRPSNPLNTYSAFAIPENVLPSLDEQLFPRPSEKSLPDKYLQFLRTCTSSQQDKPRITVVALPMFNLGLDFLDHPQVYTMPAAFATCLGLALNDTLVQVLNVGPHCITSSMVSIRNHTMALVKNTFKYVESLDVVIMKEILRIDFQKKFGFDLSVPEEGGNGPIPKRQLKALHRVLEQAELMKRRFSSTGKGRVHVESCWDGVDFVSKEWSANKFEMGLLQPWLSKGVGPLLQEGAENGVKAVIATGGLVRIPFVANWLRSNISSTLKIEPDPERTTANGCAVRARQLWWLIKARKNCLPKKCADQCPCTDEEILIRGLPEVIPRNTPLPLETRGNNVQVAIHTTGKIEYKEVEEEQVTS